MCLVFDQSGNEIYAGPVSVQHTTFEGYFAIRVKDIRGTLLVSLVVPERVRTTTDQTVTYYSRHHDAPWEAL